MTLDQRKIEYNLSGKMEKTIKDLKQEVF